MPRSRGFTRIWRDVRIRSNDFNVGNINVADATIAYLDSDKVRSGGDTDNALLQVLDDGNGGVNISVVPEPGSIV